MSRGNSRKVLWLILTLVLSGCVFAQQELSDFQKRLTKINETIQALRAKIQEENKKESTLLSQLDKIAFNIKLLKSELDLYNVQMEKTSQELSSIKKNITSLREKLQREQQAIEKTLVTLYKYGKFDFLQFLLEAQNMSALFSESKNLTFLARYQEGVIADYLKTLSELRTTEEAQRLKRSEYAQYIQDAEQKRKELEAQEAENKALIWQVQKNIKTYEQALEEQRERAQHLQSLMDKLASQEIVLPFRFVPFYEKKGKLPWPITPKKVITRFGLERHPQFNTVVMNNGIEISPKQDDLIVRAIHAGKVVYADYFQGYGNLLIIDHGMNYYSLYGHCADFKVNKGDFVREDQPIAEVGDSGSLREGLSLYLEIRYKAKPLDPLQWLKRR
jgi:septal ring factor EnvC (AmiA/AmiB activator)